MIPQLVDANLQPLDLLLEQRREHWLLHCRFVLERLLMPLCNDGHIKTEEPCQRAIVLIDNRIDVQWLFTVLNTWLMCPPDSTFVLIADANSVTQAKDLLKRHAPGLKAQVLDVAQLMPGTKLTQHSSFNACLKSPSSGANAMNLADHSTDALLSRPLDPFSFSSHI